MSSQKAGLRVAAILFALFCFGHVWRLFAHLHVQLGEQTVPMWVSVVALIIAGGLSLWLWTLSKR